MENLYKYCTEKEIKPMTLAIVNLLVQVGDGIPTRYFDKEILETLQDAEQQGYVSLSNDRITLTPKAKAFVETFLYIAKDEGEL